LERLQAEGALSGPVHFLSSMLHLTPEVLDRTLKDVVARETARGHRLVLAFGDCCAHMADLEAPGSVVRAAGINCCEIILGRETYRRLRKEGAFFVMPEWALRWREVFATGLGLSSVNAQALMAEMHTCLVYLDTGQIPVPREHLADLADFTGLPLEILPVSLEPLLATLRASLRRVEAP
jgi:hypothetical protein